MAVNIKEMVLVQSGVTDFRGAFFDSANSQWTATKPLALSAGTQSGNTATIAFADSNGMTFGGSTDANGMTVTASSAAAAAGGVVISAGTQTSNNVAVFSDSNGISWGLSGSTRLTASIDAIRSVVAGASTATGSRLDFVDSNGLFFGVSGSNSLTAAFKQVSNYEVNLGGLAIISASVPGQTASFQRLAIPWRFAATQLDLFVNISGNALTAGTVSFFAALYTMTGSTANSISNTSGSTSVGILSTGSFNSYYQSVTLGTWNVTPGDYLFGVMLDSSLATVSVGVISNVSIQMSENYSGYFGDGLYSAALTTFPSSVHLSAIDRTKASCRSQPWANFIGSF